MFHVLSLPGRYYTARGRHATAAARKYRDGCANA
jgi:hypothetical protein